MTSLGKMPISMFAKSSAKVLKIFDSHKKNTKNIVDEAVLTRKNVKISTLHIKVIGRR